MDVLLAIPLIAAMALALPAKKHIRFGVTAFALLVVLAVFQTTGGRGTIGLSSTYIVVAIVALIAILSLRKQHLPLLFLPLAVYLALGMTLIWEPQSGQLGSAVNLLFGAIAWSAGALLGSLYRGDPGAERWLVVGLLLVVAFELVVCALQLAGLQIFVPDARTIELEGGRANGTFAHPSTVGKILTLVLLLVLPSTRSADAWTRRLAFVAVVASILPIVLSASRANLLAVAAMVLVWSLLQPQVGFSLKRFALPAVGGVVILVFLDQILSRFDQGTGEREHFMGVALEQLGRTPWTGVGPGSYVPVVGRFDALTAQGWPVHNIFVLQAVELGIIGATLFFLPFVIVMLRSAGRWRASGSEGSFARAVLAYVPALIAIGWTGWGWLAPDVLLFACFAFAFVSAQLRQRGEESPVGALAGSDVRVGVARS